MKPPSEASHASSSPHIVSTKDMSSGKWGSRTPSPSWDNCPATQRSHHPWDRDHRKGTEHPIGRFSSMSAGPSSPWESPGIPHLTVSPPEEYCEDPKKSRADSVAAATITQCVSSVWDDMGRYSFDFPNRPKKNSTLPSQEITPSVWDDLARPRKMAFSWDDDIASVGSAGTRRKAHPKQDGQQAPEGELALDVIHSREPLENLAITGGIATRRSSRVSGETDIGTRGGQVTMQAARDMLDRPRAASPQASSRDIPSTGRRLSVSSSWNAVHPSSILPSTLSSKVDQPDLTNPSLPMFTTRRMSAGPSQYIFLDDSAVAEATKLEFELNHQDKSAE
ncbi:hypothetical protein BX666DRAFT_1359148 [Dichotomocladium elegans]|nr:hypothetical protein BX666DRAFT_1359148 [Dichotomocladium elegans]